MLTLRFKEKKLYDYEDDSDSLSVEKTKQERHVNVQRWQDKVAGFVFDFIMIIIIIIRFIIATIEPSTRHSLLVTKCFSRLLSAF